MSLPREIEALISEFSKFPGVGRRSAERMAFDLVAAPPERAEGILAAIRGMLEGISLCPECGYFASAGECLICAAPRQKETILVVEKPLDVVAFEKAGSYRGVYHVLGGHLSPLKGIGPDDLRLRELFQRLADGTVTELILATSSSVEGDATALYISRNLPSENIKVTRLGRGVPMGGSLEFADSATLRLALEGRRALEG